MDRPAVVRLALEVALAAAGVVVLAGCGDDSREKAETKTITSVFLARQPEATTPGSGGFIETPQDRNRDSLDELGERVPEIRQAPGTGESVFTGVHRDTYLRARAACSGVSRRKLARRVGVNSTNPIAVAGGYAAGGNLAVWQAAFEGCAVGIASG